MVVVRKNITQEQGETALFDELGYFFSISNDDARVTAERIVFSCDKRCDQENLIRSSRVVFARCVPQATT